MKQRLGTFLLVAATVWPSAARAQRPVVGLGLGAGAVLGSQLAEHEFSVRIDGTDVVLAREVDLEDVAVLSAHGEWYVTRHIALRAHGARGGGRLQVRTAPVTDGEAAEAEFESDFGDVGVTALDVGIGLWPWAPGTVGFAPFFSIGAGRYAYDFDAVTADGLFRAEGRRSGSAWLVGIGADLNVWHSIMLRIEAVDHRVDSPLRASDFDPVVGTIDPRAFGGRVDNIRLTLGAHINLPFRSVSLPDDP